MKPHMPHMLIVLLLICLCTVVQGQDAYDLIGVQGDASCNTVVTFEGKGNTQPLTLTVSLNDVLLQTTSVGVNGSASVTVGPGTSNDYWINVKRAEADKGLYRWRWELSCTPGAQVGASSQSVTVVIDPERLEELLDEMKRLLALFAN